MDLTAKEGCAHLYTVFHAPTSFPKISNCLIGEVNNIQHLVSIKLVTDLKLAIIILS